MLADRLCPFCGRYTRRCWGRFLAEAELARRRPSEQQVEGLSEQVIAFVRRGRVGSVKSERCVCLSRCAWYLRGSRQCFV